MSSGRRFARAVFVVTVVPLALAPLLAPDARTSAPVALGGLVFLGSALHYAATGALFSVAGVRHLARSRPTRLIVAPVLAALVSLLAIVFAPSRDIDVLLYVFFAWQFAHYAKQNLGVVCLTASGVGVAPLSTNERRAVVLAGLAGVAAVVARGQLLDLPRTPGSSALMGVAVCCFGVAVIVGAHSLARRSRRDRPVAYLGVFLAALAFPLPAFLLSTPYSALSGMTIAHGLQYIAIVGLVSAPRARTRRSMARTVLVVSAVVASAFLIHLSSHVPSNALTSRLEFGVYLGVATAHFVFDATFWRVRDPGTRAVLASRLPGLVKSPSPRASIDFDSQIPCLATGDSERVALLETQGSRLVSG
jgi:hypothetical protein